MKLEVINDIELNISVFRSSPRSVTTNNSIFDCPQRCSECPEALVFWLLLHDFKDSPPMSLNCGLCNLLRSCKTVARHVKLFWSISLPKDDETG